MPECIIDIHTHIYPSVLARRAMKVAGREHDAYENLPVKENLLSRMQEEGICLSIVQPVVSKPETQRDVNRFAREVMRPGIISFGGLHPDCAHVEEELERLEDMGFSGVKFPPPFQKVFLPDERYHAMWKRINHLRLPVLIHCGSARVWSPYDLYPSGLAGILRLVPDVPVILAHMGGRSTDPGEERELYNFPENVWIDTAMSAERQPLEDFERIVEAMGPERVVFGSDFPYGTEQAAIHYIKNSCFSAEEKAKMLGGNAARLLPERALRWRKQ